MFLEQNRSFLEQTSPYFLEILDQVADLSEFQVLNCEIQGQYLKWKTTLLNSRMNSIAEARRWARQQKDRIHGKKLIILFGFELGYRCLALAELYPQLSFIGIDRLEILKQALSVHDFGDLLQSTRLHFFSCQEVHVAKKFLGQWKLKQVQSFIHSPSFEAFRDSYKEAFHYVHTLLNSYDINQNTLERFQDLWIRNLILNLPYYLEYSGVESLRGCLNRDTPVFLIGGGSSLEKQKKEMKQLKSKGIVICSSTSLNFLLEEEVIPDIIVVIDPQMKIREHFYQLYRLINQQKIPKSSIPLLVLEPTVYPSIARHYPGKTIFCQTSLLQNFVLQFSHQKGHLESGGSVITQMMSLGILMGSQVLVFVGVDLSFSNEVYHFQGSELEKHWFFCEQDYFKPLITLHWNLVNRKVWRSYLGVKEGMKVYTNARFLTYLQWIERTIQKVQTGNFHFINTSDLGVHIEGTVHQDLGFLINSLPLIDRNSSDFDQKIAHFEVKIDQIRSIFEQKMIFFNKIKRFSIEAISVLSRLFKIDLHQHPNQAILANNLIEQLNGLDADLMSLLKEDELISIPMQKVINAINFDQIEEQHYSFPFSETHMVPEQKSFKNSYYLYQELHKTVKTLLDLFNKFIHLTIDY